MASNLDRRTHDRFRLETDVRVRRLGLRSTDDERVQAVDVSMGGIRLRVLGDEYQTGDVVMVTMYDGSPLPCKGLVVTKHNDPSGIACHVHVAWTNLAEMTTERLGMLLSSMAVA